MKQHERTWSGRSTEVTGNRTPEGSQGPFPSEDQQRGAKMKKGRSPVPRATETLGMNFPVQAPALGD